MRPSLRILGLAILVAMAAFAPLGRAPAGAVDLLLAARGLSAAPAAPAPAGCPAAPLAAGAANRLGYNELFGVAAVAADDVWAVGEYFTPTTAHVLPLAEHWDGAAWAVVPVVAAGANSHFYAVAAASSDDVWAVGAATSGPGGYLAPLTEHWDGHAWEVVASPNPAPAFSSATLAGVAAISGGDAWAVGTTSTSNGPAPLILHWDGHAWSQVPAPAGASAGTLNAVAAVAPDDVWTVGSAGGSPILLHWNGTGWAAVPGPDNGHLNAVSVRAPNDAWAAGSYIVDGASQPLLLHWDGTAWRQSPGAAVAGASDLRGIAALARDDVWAVGYTYSRTNPEIPALQPLTEHWDGHAWSAIPGPAVASGALYAVAAVPAAGPWAVGGQDTPQTLTAQWTGRDWTIAPSPSPGRATNYLIGATAASADDVWAVGAYESYGAGNSRTVNTLTEHWDGSTWRTVPSPSVSPESSLYAAAALAAGDVWAAGSVTDGIGGYGLLIEHWDGVAWSIAQRTDPEGVPQELRAVAAVSAGDAWAVGLYLGNGANQASRTLIEHWDGTAWQTVPSPNAGAGANQLSAVTAISQDDVWAAGDYADATHTNHWPLLLHWDGAAWTIVPGPTALGTGTLSGIAGAAGNDVWAVGSAGGPNQQAFVLHWDGARWAQVPTPEPATPSSALLGVTAPAAGDVWAVGYVRNGPVTGSLVLHWDGAAWRTIVSPDPGALDNRLLGVAAASATDVWMAGTASNGAPNQALLAHAGRFGDVGPADYFYTPVNYLVGRNVVAGYADCTFHPYANTTRAQLSKILVLAENWPLVTPANPHFADVPPGSPFYAFVETAFAHGVVSGYADGTFRPNAAVTRGQVSKMVVAAQGWSLVAPATPHFSDVPPGSPFYAAVETAFVHGVLSGYADGTFRPGGDATRGQVAKVDYLALAPGPAAGRK